MEYRIISERTPEKLVERVNEAIQEGWKPQGHFIFAFGYGFNQAMIRE